MNSEAPKNISYNRRLEVSFQRMTKNQCIHYAKNWAIRTNKHIFIFKHREDNNYVYVLPDNISTLIEILNDTTNGTGAPFNIRFYYEYVGVVIKLASGNAFLYEDDASKE